ncbi:porin [Hydrogenimonas thermophila]|uniref:Phosphate-selective porin O and P n=1 Tax=Hydrogenimonas thermophila TaxID=223786 RepID=A0A1I5P8V1_9BACT|nr:porin [Hydrogenimonas thermophila]SFP29961.1 hypothetical protein SAMN05216234_1148 [Hydrogenimonas thermophila]
MRKIISLFFILFSSINLYSDDYQLGEGLKVSDFPVYVGGYFSIDYKHENDYDRYRIDDLAILSYGKKDKFSYMAEFEFKELYVKEYDQNTSTTEHNSKFHIERLYIDYTINDNYSIRVGKYNSPIGYWNLMPINVLRETTSSPVSTYIIFPKFTTGVTLKYQNYESETLDVEFLAQQNEDIDDEYNNYKIDEHYGVSVEYEKDTFSLKFNGGYFHLNKSQIESSRYYAMLSAQIERERYQILCEIGRQYSNNLVSTPYALYLQGLYYFNDHNIGVLRFESYKDKVMNKDDEIVIFGYTYRPLYPVALKAEYQIHSEEANDKLLFSFSVLF